MKSMKNLSSGFWIPVGSLLKGNHKAKSSLRAIGEDGTPMRVCESPKITTCFISICTWRPTSMRRLFISGFSSWSKSTLRRFIHRWGILHKSWCPSSSMSSQNAPKYLSFIQLDLWGTYGKLWWGCTNVLISPATVVNSCEQVATYNVKQEEAEQNIKSNLNPRPVPWRTGWIHLQLHWTWADFQVHPQPNFGESGINGSQKIEENVLGLLE